MKKVGNFTYNEAELAKLCEGNDIKYLALFGSYLHGTNKPSSDIDFLVEFKNRKSLFELVDIKDSLESKLGKKIDLLSPKYLSPYFKNEVEREAKVIYEG